MDTLLKFCGYCLMFFGLFLLFGAAGTSDVDPYFPLTSLMLMSGIGLGSMFGGYLILAAVGE